MPAQQAHRPHAAPPTARYRGGPVHLSRLAALAGNAAVTGLLRDADGPRAPTGPVALDRTAAQLVARRSATTVTPAVQRAPASPAPAPTDAQSGSTKESRLTSPDPEVNGKTVDQVAADLSGRDQRYRQGIDRLRANAVASQHGEQDWYAKLGPLGGFIDWFNSVPRTDPTRWEAALQRWDSAAGAFDAVLAQRVTPQTINAIGRSSSDAMRRFDEAYRHDGEDRAQFAAYLQGFQQSAKGTLTVANVVRDVAFAGAVGVATVGVAPVVAGALATAGAGTLLTYGGTAVAVGLTGAGIEGLGRAEIELGTQAIAALLDLVHGSEKAADNVDIGRIAQQGWEGIQRGFVDGVLAFTGIQAEKALASAVGPVIKNMLGPNRSSLTAMIIRRALTRAVSGGVTGSVIGALQAGLTAAITGEDLAGIAAAMKKGFTIGAAAGGAVGAAGGAVEAWAMHKVYEAVVPKLRKHVGDPASVAKEQGLFDDLQLKLANNPNGEPNRKLAEVLPRVWSALRDPDRIANVVTDIWLEERLLGLVAPQDAASRYGEAAMVLTRRTGAPVVVLQPGQKFNSEQFFMDVVVKGNRFLDLSALKLSKVNEHGAHTHLIQDLVADRALRGTGMRAEQVRQLFADAVDAEGRKIGNDLWITIYDSMSGQLNQPEVVYPIIAEALGGLK